VLARDPTPDRHLVAAAGSGAQQLEPVLGLNPLNPALLSQPQDEHSLVRAL